MDSVRKFERLRLHDESRKNDEDCVKTPFIISAKLKEAHKKQIYGCAFNQYIEEGHSDCVATVGGNNVTVYEVPKEQNDLILRRKYTVNRDEDFYTVCWCLDTYELENGQSQPYRIVTGGSTGRIYIFDPYQKDPINYLSADGNTVNDIRPCPTNSNLVAAASGDFSIRIFHIRNETCVVVMSGLWSHVDQVLSVDWEQNGQAILSTGFDHRVIRWDLSEQHVVRHLKTVVEELDQCEMNTLSNAEPLPRVEEVDDDIEDELELFDLISFNVTRNSTAHIQKVAGILHKPIGCVLTISFPHGLSKEIHNDYTDCVRSLTTGYNLSKQAGEDASLSLWRFGTSSLTEVQKEEHYEAQKDFVRLCRVDIPNGDSWFTKFEVDSTYRWVAIGGIEGSLAFFDLHNLEGGPCSILQVSNNVIRQVSFSPHGEIAVAVGDGSSVVRLDRVKESVNKSDLAAFMKR